MQQLNELGCGQFGTVTLYKVPQLNMHIAVKAQLNPDNRQDKEYENCLFFSLITKSE